MSKADIIQEFIKEVEHLNKIGNVLGIGKHIAIQNVLEYVNLLEEKLIYALSPTNHELALETKRNFKEILRNNIDEDTYTIKQELKKYWKGNQ